MTEQQIEAGGNILYRIRKIRGQKKYLNEEIDNFIRPNAMGEGELLTVGHFTYSIDISMSIYATLIKHLEEEEKKLSDQLEKL